MAPTHPSAQAPDPAFQGDEASAYDNRFAKLAPFKEALHLVLSMALADLPVDARVLCVGVGTGAELRLSTVVGWAAGLQFRAGYAFAVRGPGYAPGDPGGAYFNLGTSF